MLVGFVLSTALGNAERYRILRKYVERADDIEALWAPVRHFYLPNERDPFRWLPGSLHTRSIVVRQAWPVLGQLARCDAVVVHQLEVQPLLLALSGFGSCPVIIAAQDNPPMIPEAGYPVAYAEYANKSPRRRALRRTLDVAIARRTPFHLAWSDWHGRVLKEHCGLNNSRVAVMHCGLDLESWPAVSPAPPRLTSAKQHILFVGGDFERKGGSVLLDLYRTRLHRLATLDIVTQSSSVSDEPGVTVHRNLVPGDGRLQALFASATILMLPTQADFAPWVCLEAMACGTAVVATDVGGIADMVIHGSTGLLSALNDSGAIGDNAERLLKNPSLAVEYGLKGREHLEDRFNAGRNVPRILALIKHAVRSRRFST